MRSRSSSRARPAVAPRRPPGDPGPFALSVLDRIVHNRYDDAWNDLHPVDRKAAPRAEYVGCESRSPVLAVPRTVEVVSVKDESVGLGDGTFVDSKAVALRLGFKGGFRLVQGACDWFRARGVTEIEPYRLVDEDVEFRLPVELRRELALAEAQG